MAAIHTILCPTDFSSASQDAFAVIAEVAGQHDATLIVLHAQPVIFESPVFRDGRGEARDYNRIAFEADLPRIETNTTPPCQRHISNPADPQPGVACVNPPVGADFYPIYTTRQIGENRCQWQLGGPHLAGTTQTFGGTSAAEYGPLLELAYPAVNGPSFRYNNFRRVLKENPCRALDD